MAFGSGGQAINRQGLDNADSQASDFECGKRPYGAIPCSSSLSNSRGQLQLDLCQCSSSSRTLEEEEEEEEAEASRLHLIQGLQPWVQWQQAD